MTPHQQGIIELVGVFKERFGLLITHEQAARMVETSVMWSRISPGPDLQERLERASAYVAALTKEEREAMSRRQGETWARGESREAETAIADAINAAQPMFAAGRTIERWNVYEGFSGPTDREVKNG